MGPPQEYGTSPPQDKMQTGPLVWLIGPPRIWPAVLGARFLLEREFFIHNLLVRIHLIIEMILVES